MVLFNYSTKELTAKIVYYGPGLCGKTTNLQFIFDNLPTNIHKGKMLSLATKTDRTLFFDFLPIDLGTIRGMRTRLQLYTVPGQVFYNTTRKLVLKGADGLVFVADSQKKMLDANSESFKNMETNLVEHGMELPTIPHVLQFNKRDLKDVLSVEELNAALNKHNVPIYEGVATTGIGVQDTLKAVTRLVLNSLREKYSDGRKSVSRAPAAPPPAEPAPAPVEEAVAEPEAVPAAVEVEALEVEAEPVLELAEEEVPAAEVVLEAEVESGAGEPALAMAEEADEAVEDVLEVSGEISVEPEAAPPVMEALVEESAPVEIEDDSAAPLDLGGPAVDPVIEDSPLGDVSEEEDLSVSGAVEIEVPPMEEPSPLQDGGPDGATVAIDIAAASGSSSIPAPGSASAVLPVAGTQEATIPLTVEVQGQTVHLSVTVAVRVDKS